MSLPSPNLDDRNFEQILEEARLVLQRNCPDWNDLGPGDPGVVLLEAFAHITEMMIYRLNRVPDKAFVEFLRLLGLKMHPPASAGVVLRFSREENSAYCEIPRGTRVSSDRAADGGDPPVFLTAHRVLLEPGHDQIEVPAYQCELVEGELLGRGTGLAGLRLSVAHPPIVAPTGEDLDLVIGIEDSDVDGDERSSALRFDGKDYRVWREVNDFSNLGPDRRVYIADRRAGLISFAPVISGLRDETDGESPPHALASIPAAGSEIRAWYRFGGGARGNVPAHSLTVMRDPIPGLSVTNPEAATGGRDPESLENALKRGPQELRARNRAVTATDYELLARTSSGIVGRAKAYAKSSLWAYAEPGTVEVLLVPDLEEHLREGGPVSAVMLKARETDDARERVQATLDRRRTLGARCRVTWARYKTVRVRARVVVGEEENLAAVKARTEQRLYRTIQPLSTSLNPTGWDFGSPLHASDVYNTLLSEPGVRFVDGVQLVVDEVPNREVRSIAADPFQPQTWYASDQATLFRSVNDGEGWEAVQDFENQELHLVRSHDSIPGLMAVITEQAPTIPEDEADEDDAARAVEAPSDWILYVSEDCGETWETTARFKFRIRDIDWHIRNGVPALYLATDQGLYEVVLGPTPTPIQIIVDPQRINLGFWTVTTIATDRGQTRVAIAAQDQGGVYLSLDDGKSGSFDYIGLAGEDVRVLEVQRLDPSLYLWAGTFTVGEREGNGCFRWELRGTLDTPAGWVPLKRGWHGGSCFRLAFAGSIVKAATHHAGVLELEVGSREPIWAAPSIDCGLAMRDVGRFHPVYSVAGSDRGDEMLFLVSGPTGVHRTHGSQHQYEFCSKSEFREKLTLPGNWLFCSGEHEISVVTLDEAKRD